MSRPLVRILIAEPFDVVRRGVRLLIEAHDCYRIVGEASDGHEALQIIRETSPSVAIVAYMLPGLNGVELTRKIRRDSPNTQVMIYTHLNKEDVILDALRAGAKGFVLKSDAEHGLIAALDALSVNRPYFSEQVSQILLDRFIQSQPEPVRGSLTHREREVVQLIAEGRLNKQVADRLQISVKTVETHRASVMHRLKLSTTADLVRYAIRNNIVQA